MATAAVHRLYPFGSSSRRQGLLSFLLPVLLLLHTTTALDNGLGRTPAMGFNTWNKFGCHIDETLVKGVAQAMVDTGLAALGYTYINLDDCWMEKNRTADGHLVEDATKFPSGLKALGDMLHGMGFQFGIYSSAGFATCEGYPASLGVEAVDAQTWADWGVDYLKYDNCHTDGTAPELRYPPMRDALNATGRPILYSMCEWGLNNPGAWAPAVANSWRTTPDIRDEWPWVLELVEINARRWRYARPGAFNDPDMLEVGNGGMTYEQQKSHFTLWALMKSPLLIGCDLRTIDTATLDLLANKEVIAVNQDPLGVQGRRVWSTALEEEEGVVDAIVVPCVLPADGGEDALLWKLESQQMGDKDPHHHGDVPTTTIRLLGKDGGVGDNLCLSTNQSNLSAMISHLMLRGKAMAPPLDALGVSLQPCSSTDDGGAPVPQQQQWLQDGAWLKPMGAPNLCLGVVHSNLNALTVGVSLELTPCNATYAWQQWATTTIKKTTTMVDTEEAFILQNGWQNQCLAPETDAPPGAQEVWMTPLADGGVAVLLFNRSPEPARVSARWTLLGLSPTVMHEVRDLWQRTTLPREATTSGILGWELPGHGSALFKVTPVS